MTTDPIRDREQLHRLANYFLERNKIRNYVMIILGVSFALRISDILSLQWSDVMNLDTGRYKTHIVVIEKKTKKKQLILINKDSIKALQLLYPLKCSAYIFASTRKEHNPINRSQAWKIIKDAANDLGLDGNIACHSLRKTYGYQLWRTENVSPVVIMKSYNHDSYETTKRYLGVDQDELDEIHKICLFSKNDEDDEEEDADKEVSVDDKETKSTKSDDENKKSKKKTGRKSKTSKKSKTHAVEKTNSTENDKTEIIRTADTNDTANTDNISANIDDITVDATNAAYNADLNNISDRVKIVDNPHSTYFEPVNSHNLGNVDNVIIPIGNNITLIINICNPSDLADYHSPNITGANETLHITVNYNTQRM